MSADDRKKKSVFQVLQVKIRLQFLSYLKIVIWRRNKKGKICIFILYSLYSFYLLFNNFDNCNKVYIKDKNKQTDGIGTSILFTISVFIRLFFYFFCNFSSSASQNCILSMFVFILTILHLKIYLKYEN